MKRNILSKRNILVCVVIILAVAGIGATSFFVYKNYTLKGQLADLQNQFSQTKVLYASTTAGLQATISSTTADLAQVQSQRDDFEQKYYDQYARVNQLYAEVQNIQGTVGNLTKLSQLDPALLKKYSKVYFLSENYAPASLTKIDPQYTYDTKKDYFFLTQALPFLQEMMAAATADGVDIKVTSAYRSFYDQQNLNSYYNVVFGSGANSFSAEQGYSEHQLGTAVDFTTESLGGQLTGFDQTPAYKWLEDNAYKYGFVLSYPQGNPYYIYEPWHWRFVGRALADQLHQNGEYFYDMSQTEIDKFLINIFD